MKEAKILFMILAIVVLTGFMPVSRSVAKKVNEVPIKRKNFPDPRFRFELENIYDQNKDGILSKEELERVTKFRLINYDDDWVIDLTGIEYFPNIKEVEISYQIQEQDFKKYPFTTAKKISLYEAEIRKMDFSHCKNLKVLECFGGDVLEEINVNQNHKLERIRLSECKKMKKLNISGCEKLKKIDVSNCAPKTIQK